jgi:hypothetical protein
MNNKRLKTQNETAEPEGPPTPKRTGTKLTERAELELRITEAVLQALGRSLCRIDLTKEAQQVRRRFGTGAYSNKPAGCPQTK